MCSNTYSLTHLLTSINLFHTHLLPVLTILCFLNFDCIFFQILDWNFYAIGHYQKRLPLIILSVSFTCLWYTNINYCRWLRSAGPCLYFLTICLDQVSKLSFKKVSLKWPFAENNNPWNTYWNGSHEFNHQFFVS